MSKHKYQSYLVTFLSKGKQKTLCVTVGAGQPLETHSYTSVQAITAKEVRAYLDKLPNPNPDAYVGAAVPAGVSDKDGHETV